MILEVTQLVARHCRLPDTTARQLRVAFLRTTEPTFLVFAAHQAHPLFVVKAGEAGSLAARGALAARLHALMPDTIAKPLGVIPLHADRVLLVQDGLPGVPWFRLGDLYQTAADWRALRTRAINRLRQFHAAVRTQADWVSEPRRLDAELRAMAARLDEELAPLGEGVHALVASASSEFAALGPVRGLWQHGDFVLNNLLVDDQRLAVLDLDDFGKWRTPFVDAFALAHSVHLLAGEHVAWPHLSDDLAVCATAESETGVYSGPQKVAFVVYFLLAAMIDTLHKPTRATIRLSYRATLLDLLDNRLRYQRAFEEAPLHGA